MSIYTPYFYIIQDVRNGMYYAGSKWSKSKSKGIANPATFMIEGGYTTSSSIINDIIERFGIKTFIIRKLRIFKNGKEAEAYEKKFLQRVNARKHKNFYNMHNNEKVCIGTEEFEDLIFKKFGVRNVSELDWVRKKIKKSNEENWRDEEFVRQYNKKYTKTCMERYGLPFHTQSESTKAAQRKTNIKNRGVENPSHCPKVCAKISSATRKTKGTDEWKSTEGKALGIRSKNRFTGQTIITNGVDNRWFDPADDILPDGWRFGRAEQIKQKGTVCYTNGHKNKFFRPGDEIPDCWWKGSKTKKKGN